MPYSDSNYVENDSSVVLDPQNPDPVWRTASRGVDNTATEVVPEIRPVRPRAVNAGPSPVRRGGASREDVDPNDISFLVESSTSTSSTSSDTFSIGPTFRVAPSYVERERVARHLDPEEARKVEAKARQDAQKKDFESRLDDMGPAERAAFLRFAGMRSRNKENIYETS